MNKLQELIQTLCPGGIEYKELQEICHYSKNRINASEVDNTTYVGVENLLQNKQGKTLASSVPTTGNVIRFDIGDILIGNIRPYLKKIWLSDCVGGTNGDVLVVQINNRKIIIPEFLYYVLSSDAFFTYDMLYSKGAKMPRGNKVAVMQYRIPVPPLEVQKEIVRLLDDFTANTAELQDKLNEELETRKKQYEYYRNLLLNANKSNTVMKLGDVADVGVGNKPVEILNDSTDYEYINAGTTNSGYTHEWNCSGDTVTTPSRGQGGIGFVGYQSNNFWLGPLCYKIKSNKDWVTTKYLYYILSNSTEELLSLKKTGGVPALNRSDLIQMKISIPSLEEQNHIVDILDQFDSTYNNLKITLPTEIESRQKQYEFYRDKLLTFKELNESEVN